MMPKVISLRPLRDFYELDVYPSKDITALELSASSSLLKQEILKSDGIILPAVGSKLDSSLFEGSKIKLIQVTGAGFDRLNVAELSALGIPVANIPGGSASAVSEYVVSVALSLLRNLNYCTKSIIRGEYSSLRNEIISAGHKPTVRA
jgi:phosphoglycerate dehydrogenase-like enzyme